ncbi:hypothetical protein ACIA8G_05940 [Lentzea sp. NPDC051213]|uniref:hypothetical protein n=1 Tax=Lentzea sp. NPDC051213 TaxID=3364126 RepID=UPI0037A40107
MRLLHADCAATLKHAYVFYVMEVGTRYVRILGTTTNPDGRLFRGGDGEAEGGFDCSELTKVAYHAAGVELSRTAHAT